MRTGQTTRRIFVFTLLLAVSAAAGSLLTSGRLLAADAARGELLYQNHCMVCHTSIVHVREQRKASSREEIRAWILKWQSHLGLDWEAGEVDDVAEFLNQRYYRLEKDS